MKKAKSTLTGQELEIMKVVWKLGTPTVRQVYETLLEHRKVAYTTVMTMMNILEQKGHLAKTQEDRAYLYRSTKPRNQVLREFSLEKGHGRGIAPTPPRGTRSVSVVFPVVSPLSKPH